MIIEPRERRLEHLLRLFLPSRKARRIEPADPLEDVVVQPLEQARQPRLRELALAVAFDLLLDLLVYEAEEEGVVAIEEGDEGRHGEGVGGVGGLGVVEDVAEVDGEGGGEAGWEDGIEGGEESVSVGRDVLSASPAKDDGSANAAGEGRK